MIIRQVTFISLAVVAFQANGMDRKPQQKQTPFNNYGAIVNPKGAHFSHYGPFTNHGVIFNQGNFQTGMPPHSYYQPHVNPYAQPMHPGRHFYQQPTKFVRDQIPAYDPRTHLTIQAQNRPLTLEEQENIKTVERFAQFSDLLPKNLRNSVNSTTKLTGTEKAIVATNLGDMLNKNEAAQDIKNVLMPIFGDEKTNIQPMSPEKKTPAVKLLQPKEDPSFFFFKPNPTLAQPIEKPFEKKPLFYTAESSSNAGIAPSPICVQLFETDQTKPDNTWNKVLTTRHIA